ncbi:MAG: response regulator [Desulfobacteraceae bacterium]|nr:MAG: response regulator [Desulfobacteraceae bacterium]
MENFRVLVVDDEPDFLETVVNRLLKRKIDAAPAPSGEAAMELLKENNFDVVLLDVKMPGGVGGIEVLREIKKLQPLTEVILLTGHASVETSIDGLKSGAFDYLIKPVKFTELMEKLIAAFEKKNVQEQKIRGAKIREIINFE